ncbi:carboxypeptidase [Paramyrothecium foliicola]|nr:carboxypeptidase [Paramyrothecium foliicola]
MANTFKPNAASPMSVMVASLLITSSPASAAFLPPSTGALGQIPLQAVSSSHFKCDLPPVLRPADDGLPLAIDLFSSHEALLKQVERHQAVVRVPSICYDDLGSFEEDKRWEPFYEFHNVLAKTYPLLHKRATLDKINTFGLVYTIEGSDKSLKPTMLTAHQDVVPVADASTWTHPPFEAVFDGEWLWGRGASDDKNSMTALVSALETLLSIPHWQPRRTIILAFGFDEECSGYRGAASIGKYLTEKYGDDGVAVILDEGGIGQQRIGDTIYALPAVTEKGHVDIWFQLDTNGGHSSIPFPHTGIGIMAEIVTALEAHPFEPKIIENGPVYNHLVCQARYSPDAHPEITDLLKKGDLDGVAKEMAKLDRMANFMIQTSQAVDYISGGQKINAMPEVVKLGVNYRIAPQEGSAEAVQHKVVKAIKEVVSKYNITVKAFEDDDDYEKYVAEMGRVDFVQPAYEVDYNNTLTLTTQQKTQISPVSPTSGAVWDIFSGTIQNTFAFDGVVVPVGQTMTGNTDTRHYLNLTPNIYRWSPSAEGASLNIHTVDERVLMSDHLVMVQFYYDFIRNLDIADI